MGAQSLDYPNFMLRRHTRIYAAGAHGAREFVLAHFVYLRARQTFAGAREYAELFRRGAGGARMVAGYHNRRYSRAAAGFDRLICLFTRRILHADKPAECQPRLAYFSPVCLARGDGDDS